MSDLSTIFDTNKHQHTCYIACTEYIACFSMEDLFVLSLLFIKKNSEWQIKNHLLAIPHDECQIWIFLWKIQYMWKLNVQGPMENMYIISLELHFFHDFKQKNRYTFSCHDKMAKSFYFPLQDTYFEKKNVRYSQLCFNLTLAKRIFLVPPPSRARNNGHESVII